MAVRKPEGRVRFIGHTAPTPFEAARLCIISVGHFLIQSKAYRCSRLSGYPCEHLIYTIRGSGAGVLAGRPTQSEAGSLWFMPKDKPYEYWLAPGCAAWEGRWVEYDGAWARDLWRMMGLDGITHLPGCLEAATIVEELHEHVREGSTASLHLATARLWQLFAAAEARLKDQRLPAGAAHAAVERAQRYVRAHLAEPVTLEDLAREAHLSPFHFIRVFRKRTGFTPHAYVRAARVGRAQELLRAGAMSVKEAARSAGFASPQYFCAAFKHATGLSPRAFARQHRDA